MIPFRKQIEEVFRSDRSIWLKMTCGAFVGAMLALFILSHAEAGEFPLAAIVTLLVMYAALGAILGICLSVRDLVRRRISDGKPVSLPLRMYFNWGAVSGVIWTVTILAALTALIVLSRTLRGVPIF